MATKNPASDLTVNVMATGGAGQGGQERRSSSLPDSIKRYVDSALVFQTPMQKVPCENEPTETKAGESDHGVGHFAPEPALRLGPSPNRVVEN